MEIVADDADTADIVRAIHSAADPGPGWLWVTAVDSVSRLDAASCRARAPVPPPDRGRGPGDQEH